MNILDTMTVASKTCANCVHWQPCCQVADDTSSYEIFIGDSNLMDRCFERRQEIKLEAIKLPYSPRTDDLKCTTTKIDSNWDRGFSKFSVCNKVTEQVIVAVTFYAWYLKITRQATLRSIEFTSVLPVKCQGSSMIGHDHFISNSFSFIAS
jgi:hypothetical protein